LDINDLKEILRILEEQAITEFELEQDGVKLRVCRTAPAPVTAPPAFPSPAPAPAAAPIVPLESVAAPVPIALPKAAADEAVIKSPIVGTFYRSPDPNSPPFVSVGDTVRLGQVLCIIEAMKLMNEIEAEMVGEVLKVHVENGQPVQYGEPLFTLRPTP
jgi:acetyl-CoA carboxylase biotin carboxyl carrier protein